jgi:hypothetical protein
MTKDPTIDLLKRLIVTGGRTEPGSAEPLIEGTSLHREDVGFLRDELRARHRIDLVPNEPPTAVEEPKKPAGKAAAAAPAGRSSAPLTSDPEDEDELPEDEEDRSRSRKLRSRIARLELEISKLTKAKK